MYLKIFGSAVIVSLRLIDSHHLQPFQFSFYCYGHFGRRNLHTILAFNAFDNYAEFFAFCLEMGWILTFPSKLLIISTPFWPALFSLQKQHDGKNWEKLHLISYVEILNQMPNWYRISTQYRIRDKAEYPTFPGTVNHVSNTYIMINEKRAVFTNRPMDTPKMIEKIKRVKEKNYLHAFTYMTKLFAKAPWCRISNPSRTLHRRLMNV